MGKAARILIKLSIVTLMLSAPSRAYGQEDSIPTFPGPDPVPIFLFSTVTGALTHHVETYSVNSNEPPVTYVIHVQSGNGTPEEMNRVDTLVVRVNGVIVGTTVDLINQTYFTRVLEPDTSMLLEVEIGGSPDAYVAISIFPEEAPSSAPPIYIFGPQTYTRTNATTITDTHQFTVPAGARPPYVVHIQNGTSSSQGFPTGTVVLNGTTILVNKIHQDTAAASQQVTLQSNNTLAVTLKGKNNQTSSMSLWITGTDSIPPVLTVTGPAEGTVTRDSVMIVTGTATDNLSVVVRVNDIPATMGSTGSFRAVVPLATNGTNTLNIVATDAAGLMTTIVRNVIRDGTAPGLTITSPADLLVTSTDSVLVAGTVTDPNGVTVNANGISLPVGQGGAFSGMLALTSGLNIITITATDAAGNASSVVLQVTFDNAPPTLTLTSPADSTITRADSILVSGTALDAGPVTLTANGQGLTVGINGGFLGYISLAAGNNTITITATDGGGNATTITRTIVRDTAAPALVVNGPANNTITARDTVTVHGTVTDQSAFELTVNGTPVTVASSGSFQELVTLAEGTDTIVVVATDAAGNSVTVERIVVSDGTAPVLAVTAPEDSLLTRLDSVAVNGSVSDATAVSVTVNSSATTVASGAFATSVALVDGANTVSVAATDAAANGSTITRTVIRDATPPVLVVTAPVDSTITSEANTSVTGTVTDAHALTLTVNGAAITPAPDGSFTAPAVLAEGANTIHVVATDAAGNESARDVFVRLDTGAPAVLVASPVDGLITKADSVSVNGTASDATALSLTINGVPVGIDGSGAFATNVALSSETIIISVIADDEAGNRTIVTRTVTRDTIAPVVTVTAPADNSSLNADSVTVTGTASDAHAFTLTINSVEAALGAGGSFSETIALIDGPNAITLVATDTAGNVRTSVVNVTRQSLTVPPDPVTTAPPINPTIATSMIDATAFLYTGPDAIQTGVAPGTIKPMTVAVLRGRVMNREGVALPGVEVTIANRPELGKTYSRVDGAYDVAVNGGGILIVNLARPGYLPAQRQAEAPWRDYAPVEDVRLVQLDTSATVIDFSAPIQTARGSVVTDDDGSRQATMMFEQGTAATMVLPNGTTQPLSSLTVRATEYTGGANGPDAMPASLPINTSYTYAAELSADEAVAAGASTISFSKPVKFYLDNFIGFPTGSVVPFGTYDRVKTRWEPGDNGRVIAILSTSGGVASVDVAGNGQAADAATLSQMSFTNEELQQLASLYQPGKTLWRTLHPHFSIGDWNWRAFLGPDDKGPSEQSDSSFKGPSSEECGSVIGCESQVLGETVPISGTPFALVYGSDRVPGRRDDYTIKIPLSVGSLPARAKRIDLEVGVAGRLFKQSFPAVSGQVTSFVWDGLDPYGRKVQGRQLATIEISYVYDAMYQLPAPIVRAFGQMGLPVPIPNITARQEMKQTQRYTQSLGIAGAAYAQLGGWTLDVHHMLDLGGFVSGDGSRRSISSSYPAVRTVAGLGACGFNGDNRTATTATICSPQALAVGPDGSWYLADGGNNRIRRISPEGTITTVAGSGVQGFSGDGGPATQAALHGPGSLEVARDGSIYFIDVNNRRIRKIDPSGIISTIAGNGTQGFSGDGGPATQAQFNLNYGGIAIDAEGTVYFADEANNRVRAISPLGTINTVVGTGVAGFAGDSASARDARISSPEGIALTPSGDLLIADAGNRRIRKVTNGTITTVAGSALACSRFTPTDPCGDGGLATAARIAYPHEVEFGEDGSIYFIDLYLERVRRVSPDGYITTVLGNGTNATLPNGGAAARTGILGLNGIALAPDGSLYYSEAGRIQIRKVEQPIPSFSISDVLVASENGGEVYVFNTAGRHLRTLHPVTGDTLLSFNYDSVGALISLVDADNNSTVIERNPAGEVTAIAGPYGQRTTFALTPAGYLSSVTNPNNEATTFTYFTGGLLHTFKTPRNHTYEFTYDADARLIRDDDPAGGSKSLTRFRVTSNNGATDYVTVTTEMGRATRYGVTMRPTGEVIRSTTGWNGLSVETREMPNDSMLVTSSSGMVSTQVRAADPRFGLNAPFVRTATISTPSGLKLVATTGRSAVLAQSGNPFSMTSSTDTLTINGRRFLLAYNAVQKQYTATSPLGRQSITRTDAQGRVTERLVTGITPVTYGYDAQGRIDTISQGTRSVSFTYDLKGRRATSKDALGRIESYFYDDADRITRQVLANGREINFLYDANDNLRSITPPTRPAHTFDHTAVDFTKSYSAPALGAGERPTEYSYNLDRQLTEILRPDSGVIGIAYDSAGRPYTMTIPDATYRTFYNAMTGNIDSLTARGVGLGFMYDGALLKRVSWSGQVSGSVGVVYDNNFRIVKQEVNHADTVSFGYDDDGLLTSAGSLIIGRNPQTGLLTGTTLGSVATTQGYTLFAELNTLVASYAGASLLEFEYGRDATGRIIRLVEKRGGNRKLLEFVYDSIGQLTTVSTDSAVTTVYEYDANGNRIKETDASGVVVGSVDAQDRLLRNGTATFGYTVAGELKERVVGQDTTRYTYDAVGNLKTVILASGSVVEYSVDGANRRIAKSIDGVGQQRWLYAGSRIIAELDAGGQVISRFIYGTRGNTPDYMVKAGQTYRYVTDHLGSVRLVVNVATGIEAQEMTYDAYGDVLTDSNAGFQPFAYAGGLYDETTKLTRFGARDYDAAVGRWTAKDPIGFEASQANVYAYVGNNPVSFIDPSGLCAATEEADPNEECWKAFASLGLSVAGDLTFKGGVSTTLEGVQAWLKGGKISSTLKKGGKWIGEKARGASKRYAEKAVPGGKSMVGDGAAQMGAGLLGDDAALDAANGEPGYTFVPFLGSLDALNDWVRKCILDALGL